jgi:S-DNA-T family DNA segregation ATPase FtsK/SpoIIIE
LGMALLSLGLSAGEWRAAGRVTASAARLSVAGGRGAAGALAQGANRVGASSWLTTLTTRTPRMVPEEPAPLPRTPLPRAPFRQMVSPAPVPLSEPDDDIRVPDAPENGTAIVTTPAVRPRKPPATYRKPVQEALPLSDAGWRCPPLSLLKAPPARQVAGPSEESLQANARLLETVLSDYGVQGSIVEIRPGPVVTLYELEPAPGIRSARVIGLADDVARSLSVTAVRIATVSGRNVIGIEVPNARRETVYLSEILSSEEVEKHTGRMVLALGKDIGGTSVVTDLARMPHLMIAGTTGSGKSVGVNAMILSLLYRLSPDQCRLILIDPKMLELSIYEGIPHLMAPVVTEPAKAVIALKWTVREMERRYRAMSQLGVRNVGGYNDRVAEARAKGEVVTRRVQTGFDPDTGSPTFEEQPLALETLPFIVVVVDEMADLMMVAGKEIEQAVQRLAQMARAAGIHVIMATQRPSVDVITGTIKANFPTRISFQVISKFDSRTILGEQGAEQLLGMGDMLFMQGGGRITRVHGPFVSDEEVEAVVAFLREQGEPAYVEEVTEPTDGDPLLSSISEAGEGEKGLFDQAVAVVAREGKASTSFIQRHLNIGYNRAAKLIEQMEKEGIVSTANHVGKREILVRRTHDED